MLSLKDIGKQFRNGFVALESVDLDVQPGEIVSLVGTSGCGKSTLLRIIAGLETATIGQVELNGDRVTAPHPAIGMVFQEPRLMPWLTVEQNVQFGLDAAQSGNRLVTNAILAKVGLVEFAKAFPRQLSGGMAQRVAIARALVTNPAVLLLDEPFSALDAFTRTRLQDHLLHLWQSDRPTLILVTHDIEEALVLSDRVVVMRGTPGQIQKTLTIDVSRPRKRTDLKFQRWKEELLNELDLSSEARSFSEV